jgi:hypothetical protein
LKGVHIDQIKHSKDISGLSNSANLWDIVRSVWINLIIPLQNSGRYINREHLSNVFAQSLTVNAAINGANIVHLLNTSDFAAYCSSNLEIKAKNMASEADLAHLSKLPMPTPIESVKGDGELFARSIETTKPLFISETGFISRVHRSVTAGETLLHFPWPHHAPHHSTTGKTLYIH